MLSMKDSRVGTEISGFTDKQSYEEAASGQVRTKQPTQLPESLHWATARPSGWHFPCKSYQLTSCSKFTLSTQPRSNIHSTPRRLTIEKLHRTEVMSLRSKHSLATIQQ